MRLLMFGIYQIGVNALDSLVAAGAAPVAVVTKPSTDSDRQPVAACARKHGIPLLEPRSPKEPEFVRAVAELRPELIVVAGYHKIIPAQVLDTPPLGTLNLHGSLLPRYRGPNTWKWAIINGEKATGVTVHVMTPHLDQGEILTQRVVPISDDDTAGSLFAKISLAGGELLADTVLKMAVSPLTGSPQDESQASYYGYPSEDQTRIIWGRSAVTIRNLIRGVNPSPGAWTTLDDRRLRVWEAALAPQPSLAFPGQVVQCGDGGLTVATTTHDLTITAMSLDGEPPEPAARVAKRLGISSGDRFPFQHQGALNAY